MAAARPAVTGQWVFMLLSFLVLAWAFYKNDFSVLYVAQQFELGAADVLPLHRRVGRARGLAAAVGARAVHLVGRGGACSAATCRETFAARVLGVLGIVSIGFQLFILLTSSPFERLIPAAADGRDLNPLLQDPALAVHPPMLYIGYVGFSVAFAFAVAALLEGKLDEKWARWARPWTTLAWMFLTVGIALGSWWAYYELGWGGWWFWDPVENASFMPWLVGTALIHSLAVTEKRGLFKSWTLLLAIITFSLQPARHVPGALGRAGVGARVRERPEPRPVHPRRSSASCVGGSLALFAWRGPALRTRGGFDATVARVVPARQQRAAAGRPPR